MNYSQGDQIVRWNKNRYVNSFRENGSCVNAMAATMLIYAKSSIKGRKYEVKQTFIPGMHRAALFCFGAGQKKFFGVGRDKAGSKIHGRGGAGQLLNSGHFRGGVGWGKNFRGWGGSGQPFFLGTGRSGEGQACIPDLFFLDALASLKTMFKIHSDTHVFKISRLQSIREYC